MKSKISLVAIFAICALLAVSCNNQPKNEQAAPEESTQQVAEPSVDTTAAPVDTTVAATPAQ